MRIARLIVSTIRGMVDIVELQVYCSLEPDSWDVRPIEQRIRGDGEAEEDEAGEHNEERSQICALGRLRGGNVERCEDGIL